MIRRGDNLHTRLVNWAKIILPLVALGLLSTVFLISRKADISDTIPFAEVDLAQRAHDQGVTNPSFAGVASGGEQILFRAASVRPDPEDRELVLAETAKASLRLNGGGVVDITGQRGQASQIRKTARLEGDVQVITTTGYDIRTDAIDTRFDTLFAETPGPITGTGPAGALDAGRMILTSDPETGAANLQFTDGVKLVYNPPKSKE
ncbi:LPS export ABC transporter periplasmic protein LptC [Roseovarius nanhaiticus]|uniref:Lipopolysaccharide export system protein LptC n=1 Tax=Roseovarius nanhaiticus TaxID=573024 RepID=A0A1N7E8K4_9RHOB|nr:LPS export ABC transporter periplasmic protein LptC [Roseovarius nanhaiticus]SEK79582.1 lipopolysaccharide export system protein LptC [Roseovarius nanhaiticus]SIR84390.1 lipopolysaccharide export system protein LptC [Roseovarius nanhaiticus]